MLPTRGIVTGLTLAVCTFAVGCTSQAPPPTLGLQRSLYPGLGDLVPDEIEAEMRKELGFEAPVFAGLAWLSESSSPHWAAPPLSEYQRTGVLEAALEELRQPPFSTVSSLPTVPDLDASEPNRRTLDALRSAAAKFQYDVALLLQTGTSENTGWNPFAIGYIGLITGPRQSHRTVEIPWR